VAVFRKLEVAQQRPSPLDKANAGQTQRGGMLRSSSSRSEEKKKAAAEKLGTGSEKRRDAQRASRGFHGGSGAGREAGRQGIRHRTQEQACSRSTLK